MAEEGKRFTTRTSNILSRVGKSANANQQQAASSSAAAKSGSTTTPTITSTPKVTNTAKAMPSVTRVDISKLSVPTVTPTVTTPREQAMNLLGSKTRVEPLRVADRSNLLSPTTEKKDIKNTTLPLTVVRAWLNLWWDIAKTVTHNLYEQWLDWVNDKFKKLETARENINKAVWEWAIDLFNYAKEDISTQWEQGEWLWMVKDAVLNTAQWLPRWIARVEYWLSELLDWWVDAQWATDLKNSIKSDLDYWENTRTYKKIKETESFSDFLKNPLMYAGWTLTEMLPMFINAWVAVPTTFAQIYWETYQDYSQDESLKESWLNDTQVRLMSLWVAWVNTIIELWADLVQWIMPWTKTIAKTTEKEVRKSLTKPFMKVLSRFVKWWASEWLEEVLQNEMQDQAAWFAGSDRDLPTRADRITTFWISSIIWSILQWGNVVVNVKQNKEINTAFNEWSDAVDKIAPWVSKDDKITLFSSIVAAEVEDANMSEDRVANYEAETTELYNRIDELEQKLNTTTNEEEKQEINRQIEDANQKIKNIDEIINKWNQVVEDVNRQLQELSQQREEELPATQAINTEWWEVMISDDSVINSKPIDEMSDDEILTARAYWLKNKPTTPQERRRKKDIQNEIKARENKVILSDATKQALYDLSFDVKWMSEIESKAIINELSRLMWVSDNIDMRNKYYELMIKVRSKAKELSEMEAEETDTEERDKPSILPDTEIDDTLFFSKAGRWVGLDQYSFKIYYQDRKHIPWLKWIKVAWIEDLSDTEIMEIARSAAIVAGTLWIDFNKILENAHFSVLSLKWEEVKWAEWISWRLNTQMNGMMPNILQLAIILKDTWPAVFWHELMHLLDKEYLFRNNKLWTRWGNLSRSSLLKDPKFKTYNKPYESYKYDDTNYWDTSREILARFAEQYVAFKNDKREYDAYTWKNFYWSDAEFKKLIWRFESLLSNFSDFALETSDREVYPEIVKKMAELQYSQTQFWLWTETEIVYKLADMKGQYDEIVAEIEKVKNETLRIELETEASNLYSNFEMLNKMWEDYTQIQRTTNELQNLMDSMTTEVVPNPPQSPETIKEWWLPVLWWSNIENGIGNLAEWWNGEKLGESYMKEEDIIKMRKRKNKIKNFRKELWQTFKDIITPTISRIYNISPRVAGRLITMETQTEINIHKYRQRAKWFVETLWKLKWKQALEVKMALLDYWALASEQTEDTIEEYKKEEVAKLKEVLKRNWFKEKDINDMFYVLNDIWQQYKDAWLDITLTDMYFPRVVKDYEWLIDYMNRVSWRDIKVNKTSLLIKIRQIQSDPDMTDEEKERKIRSAISIEFKQPWTTSKHGKERKLWLLSEWWEWIYAYYENPIQSIDHYIVTMTNAIQRQLFLWWMVEDANVTESEILNKNTAESVSTIIWRLVELWLVDEEDVNELQKSILAVLNKKPSPKAVTAIKDITYISTITNFLSAINQLDDLWMVILKDRSWLKHIVKTIFWRAWIKYDDLWLEDSYEMFREEWSITNWLFKKSFFNMFDRLWKTSFVNTAWESMVRQSKNEKTRKYLYSRLVAMYWRSSADRMMDKIDRNDYRGEDGQVDIEILRDLLYQLWSTQPIYTSAMSTTYLNNPRARLCYALSSFTLKRIDWLVQGTKEVNAKHWPIAAWAWVMWVSSFLAIFWAIIWDLWDLLKGDNEETFLWKFINEWIDEALKSWWSDALDSWLKIWDLSEYDIKTYKQQWLWWVFSSKIKPFIFDLGKDITQAITEWDKDEITDLAKYVPIFWKLVYYWLWDDLDGSTDELLDLGEDLDLDLWWDLDLDLDWELLDL